MAVKTYVVGPSNKISISHTYANSKQYVLRASDNIAEINILDGLDDPAQATKYKSIAFGSNTIKIADKCCYKFTNLETVKLNQKLQSIGSYAFYQCMSIGQLEFFSQLRSIGQHAFDGCTSMTNVRLTTTAVSLGDYAFNNTGIQEIDVVVDSIGHDVFAKCKSLVDAKLEGQLGVATFMECSKLKTVKLNGSTSSIPQSCFNGCSSLKTITFKDVSSIQDIGQTAFFGCSSLTGVEFEKMSLSHIGRNAFYNTSFETLDLPTTISSLDQLDPNFLGGSNVTTLKFNGMDSSTMWSIKEKFNSFGCRAGNDLKIISSDGKTYSIDDTGLKNSGTTAFILMITQERNRSNHLDGINSDTVRFVDEIDQAYAENMSLILGTYHLSDPNAGDAQATWNNIDAGFQKAISSGADLLLFLFSDHGTDGSVGIYESTREIDGKEQKVSRMGYKYMYENYFNKFKYVFAQFDCCRPNTVPNDAVEVLKAAGTKMLVWAAGPKNVDTMNSDGHVFSKAIADHYKPSYTWKQMFDAVKDVNMEGQRSDGTWLTDVHPVRYNYNDFPESSPVFTVVQSN